MDIYADTFLSDEGRALASHHITSHHITSHHITSHHITSMSGKDAHLNTPFGRHVASVAAQSTSASAAHSCGADTFKTFPSVDDLDKSFGGTKEDNLSVTIAPVSSEGAVEVSNSEWLERISPYKTWKINYPLGDAHFDAGSEWEEVIFLKTWAACWTGDGAKSDPRIRLNLTFTTFSYDFEIKLWTRNPSIYVAPVTFKKSIKVLPEHANDLNNYCKEISKTINEAESQWECLKWMMPEITMKYDALIEKVVSAALKKMHSKRNEDPPTETA
jgi:hypothetical protein